MADREGFEPSIQTLYPYAPLAGEYLQPLGHLSAENLRCILSDLVNDLSRVFFRRESKLNITNNVCTAKVIET